MQLYKGLNAKHIDVECGRNNLETLILSSEPLVITGDFNVHVDDSNDPDATKLLDLLDSLGLCQHVTQSTHELVHTIGLIIMR